VKRYILLFIFPLLLFANVYFLPKDSNKALNELLSLIQNSKISIKAAIYTFTHKKIAKEIKKAAKRGVKVEIIFDKRYNLTREDKSMLFYLAKYKNIEIYLLKGKPYKKAQREGIMHIKAVLSDHKKMIFGSANWTYGAFNNNYEMLYSTKDYKTAKKFEKYFESMKTYSQKFR